MTAKTKLPKRVVPACVVVLLENPRTKHARWQCETCDVGGEWTAADEARAGGEEHVAKMRKALPL